MEDYNSQLGFPKYAEGHYRENLSNLRRRKTPDGIRMRLGDHFPPKRNIEKQTLKNSKKKLFPRAKIS